MQMDNITDQQAAIRWQVPISRLKQNIWIQKTYYLYL